MVIYIIIPELCSSEGVFCVLIFKERRAVVTENISHRSFSSAALKSLILELEQYRRQGVSLSLNGIPSSPQYIANACLLADGGGYMRDYKTDVDGKILKLDFNYVPAASKYSYREAESPERNPDVSGSRYRKHRRRF